MHQSRHPGEANGRHFVDCSVSRPSQNGAETRRNVLCSSELDKERDLDVVSSIAHAVVCCIVL